jgi:iron complex transport system ATP-binding protein
MSEKILTIHNLVYSYNQKEKVIKDISLEVLSGEFVGIIGPNGAGKSTLIKLAGGLLQSSADQILIQTRSMESFTKKQLARLIGYVPQEIEMPFSFSVRQVVEMGRYPFLSGLLHEDKSLEQEVDRAMAAMDLHPLADREFYALSGGEKQRTIIASVLAQQANILLLDEPTSSLDLKHQQGIYRTLKRLTEEEKKTILIVTHDINLAAQFCNRLILMDKGAIKADGSPDKVLQFQLIQKVYGVKVYIDVNPLTKSIYIIPYDTQ